MVPITPCNSELFSFLGSGSFKVLYVEDDSDNRELIRQILRKYSNVELLCAQDGESGVELARDQLPDLILMDINLPGMNGVAAFRELRGEENTASIPVIAMSADALASEIKKVVDEGFSTYITKPIDISSFIQTLEAALSTHPE